MAGTLYLCATPIGNLEDITLRVLKLMERVDVIAAEDTRNTLKLLNHFEIKTPMTSYHEHNKVTKGPVLVERLLAGESIALVTDAGMPGISDPGADLVKLCYAAGVPVTVAPGASAAVVALVLSGLDTRRFVFEGFLPPDKKERRAILKTLEREHRTMIFYEAPHRLTDTLAELAELFGESREVAAVLVAPDELKIECESYGIVTVTDAKGRSGNVQINAGQINITTGKQAVKSKGDWIR